MTRTTKCNEQTTKRICDALKTGMSYKDAAAFAGVDYTTMYRWVKRGEEEIARLEANTKAKPHKSEEPYSNFCKTLLAAQAAAQFVLAARVKLAAKKDWRAAAWILERRFSKTWGQNQDLWGRIEALEQAIQNEQRTNE